MSVSLSKTQLAWQYSPEMSQNAALNRLHRWIHGDRDLLDALRTAGYSDRQKILTYKQLTLIYDFLGRPDAA